MTHGLDHLPKHTFKNSHSSKSVFYGRKSKYTNVHADIAGCLHVY